MASDVIELPSSSDEDREPEEPPSKKVKILPNAMVHIPRHLPNLSIKLKKTSNGNGKNPMPNPFNATNKITSTNLKILPSSSRVPIKSKQLVNPITMSNLKIRNMKALNSPIQNLPLRMLPGAVCSNIKTIPSTPNKSNIKLRTLPINSSSGNPKISMNTKNNGFNCLAKLPPNVTVVKTSSINKRPLQTYSRAVVKKIKTNPMHSQVGQVLMAEFEKSEPDQPSNAMSWYRRPEETNIELKSKQPKTIEITIEDSPVKHIDTGENKELNSITIEDSPVRPVQNKLNRSKISSNSTPTSRKKLIYTCREVPIELDEGVAIDKKDIQEVVPNVETTEAPENEIKKDENTFVEHETNDSQDDDIIEIIESPTKKKVSNEKQTIIDKTSIVEEECEFDSVYQSFIELCLTLEDTEDMKKIVEKKVKAYYRQVSKEYTTSEEFQEMVSSKMSAMKAGPEKMYLYIKDIVDDLNIQRKKPQSKAEEIKQTKEAEAARFYGEKLGQNPKRMRQVKKLEKTLNKLNRAIHKLEEKEVDFDDDGDSVYILTERYKERLIRVHAKLCQLSNTKMPSEPKLRIERRPGRPEGPVNKLEKWINKRVPAGTPLPFPDFHDVLHCVREANKEDNLGWNEADIMEEARDLFTRCGRKLQRRRQENEWRMASLRITGVEDPAVESTDLKKKLEENRKLSTKKEVELINRFAEKQNQLKLEGVEIDEKDAEGSTAESEEEAEEKEDEVSLETADQRKVRLKRLLSEKSRSNSTDSRGSEGPSQVDKKITTVSRDQSDCKDKAETLPNNENENKETNIVTDQQLVKDKNTENCEIGRNNELGSDVDELNLLQKLHSGTDIASTVSSDSEVAISISDEEGEGYVSENGSEVVSIEDSSCSERENPIDNVCSDLETAYDDPKDSDFNETNDDNVDSNAEEQPHYDEDISDQIILTVSENGMLAVSDAAKDVGSLNQNTTDDAEMNEINEQEETDKNTFTSSNEDDQEFEVEKRKDAEVTLQDKNCDLKLVSDQITEQIVLENTEDGVNSIPDSDGDSLNQNTIDDINMDEIVEQEEIDKNNVTYSNEDDQEFEVEKRKDAEVTLQDKNCDLKSGSDQITEQVILENTEDGINSITDSDDKVDDCHSHDANSNQDTEQISNNDFDNTSEKTSTSDKQLADIDNDVQTISSVESSNKEDEVEETAKSAESQLDEKTTSSESNAKETDPKAANDSEDGKNSPEIEDLERELDLIYS